MFNKERLKFILTCINEGRFAVDYKTRNSFRVFVADGVDVNDYTDVLNVLYKLDSKYLKDLDTLDKNYSKIKEVYSIRMTGCGYDKAGHLLCIVAHKIKDIKELKRCKLKDSLKRGCDASYKRL